MKFCSVSDHSNETSSAVLSHDTVCLFMKFYPLSLRTKSSGVKCACSARSVMVIALSGVQFRE